MTTRILDTISHEEFMKRENGWGLYRSFQSTEARNWYFERLADTETHLYRVVDHPSRFIIAERPVEATA